MRHRKDFRKLGRNPAHRRAVMRNLATALVLQDQIETTLPKAKDLRRVADKLVTLGKKDTLHSRRQAMKYLFAINRQETGNAQKWTAVHRLFTEIAPRYSDRNGGYTRVVRTRVRDGDKAQMAVIQFVEEELQSKAPTKRKRRRIKKEEPAKKAEEAVSEAKEEEVEATPAEDAPAEEEAQVEEATSEEASAEESETKEEADS